MSIMDRLMDSREVDSDFFTSIGWRRITNEHMDVFIQAPIIKVNIPSGDGTYEADFCFKMSFDNETRVLKICAFERLDKVLKNYGAIFDNYEATGMTEEDVKLAITPEFLSSRFKQM
jgi:hypothetical protein